MRGVAELKHFAVAGGAFQVAKVEVEHALACPAVEATGGAVLVYLKEYVESGFLQQFFGCEVASAQEECVPAQAFLGFYDSAVEFLPAKQKGGV